MTKDYVGLRLSEAIAGRTRSCCPNSAVRSPRTRCSNPLITHLEVSRRYDSLAPCCRRDQSGRPSPADRCGV